MSAAREWSDLSAEARSAKVDEVATQMVEVRADAEFATRIVSSLPERRSRLFWLIPQLGAAAVVVVAVVVWLNREAPVPAETTIAMVPLRAPVDAIEPFRPTDSAFARRQSGGLRRDRLVRPTVPDDIAVPVDHERALPAVEAPGVLAMSDLAPRELPAFEPLMLQPLEIGELPLTGESFSPREY